MQLVFFVQADAPVFQQSEQVAHGSLPFFRAAELHHRPLQIFDADVCHIEASLDACGRVDQPVTISSGMTWDELSALLSNLAEEHDTKARIIPIEGLEAVFLHLVPGGVVFLDEVCGCVEHRRVSGRRKPAGWHRANSLAELTPEFVRERVEKSRRRAV